MGRLDGRVAVVTGAGGGLGGATAVALAEEGATVVSLDRSADDAEATAARCRGSTAGSEAAAVDVTDSARVDAVLGDVDRRLGRIDVLVTAAGISSHEDGSTRAGTVADGAPSVRRRPPRAERRHLAPDARRAPRRDVLLRAGRPPGHAAQRFRVDRLHLEHRRARRHRARPLLGGQGRDPRLRALAGPGRGPGRHPGERRVPGRHRRRHDAAAPARDDRGLPAGDPHEAPGHGPRDRRRRAAPGVGPELVHHRPVAVANGGSVIL